MLTRSLALILSLITCAHLLAQAPPPAQATIDVVALTPVDGAGIEADRYPANVQVLKPSRGAAADTLARRGAGVQLSEAQGNRFQADLSFRGFLASPLLGVPQGVAVFQDGVRLNDPFGDVVHWDALAEPMLDSIQLIPGSNAAFGLNALGGVITLRTKTGLTDPGLSAQIGAGSFGSRLADVSAGWGRGATAYFLAASHQEERGWRDFAPSRLGHLFGSAQWARQQGSSDLRLTAVDTVLTGNGPAPVQLLAERRAAVFTHPDETRNRALLLSSGHHALTRAGLVEVNVFARRATTRTRNGDETPYEPCENDPLLLCEDDSDELVVDPRGDPFPVTDEHPLDAVLNRTVTAQTVLGTNAQLGRTFRAFGGEHRTLAGVSFDRGTAAFSLDAELADLTDTRAAEGIGRIAADSVVRLDATTTNASLYFTDAVALSPRFTLTAAARVNRTAIRLRDRAGDDLNGDHDFTSVNPSLGFAFDAGPVTLFGSAGQASRTPTPVELTCANPDDPCRLPNAFVSDPPLDQVIARTIELGARRAAGGTRWSVAAFRTATADDILFISSGRLRGTGYFTNVGRTSRTGLEASIEGNVRSRLQWNASYSLIDAVSDTAFTAASPHHPLAEDDEIHVAKGDRLPLVPRYTVKLGATLRASRVDLSAAARYSSSAYFRGDEANLAEPLPAYVVADLGATINVAPRVAVELAVTNATNASYETFGTFGDPEEVLGDDYDDGRFVSPAQPRAVRVTFRVRR